MSFWANFWSFTPLKTKKIKMKKIPGDIIILNMCTINEYNMMHDSWEVSLGRHNFLSFWAIFSIFAPLITRKIKILKKWRKHLEISWFYTSVPKIMIIYYIVPEILCMTDVTFIFHFLLFLTIDTPNGPKNQNFNKNANFKIM